MSTDTDTPTTDPEIGEQAPAVTLVPGPDPAATGPDANHGGSDPGEPDAGADITGEHGWLDELCTGPTVNPADLEIDENVRKTFRLEDHPEVTDSIREHGVRDPILVIRMPDKRLVVRDGQVRTLTALAFELPEVPVYIRDFDPSVDTNEAEIERIFEQITLNDRRIPLTNSDRAAGITQALDLGASVTRVAKALQTKRDEVKLVGKVGASPTARNLIDDDQYDLAHAAVIAEYENVGDHDAVRRLLNVRSGVFDFEANRIAADRAERRAYLADALPYAQAGLGILTDYPDLDDTDTALLCAAEIVDGEGNAIDFATIAADPGAWLVWLEVAEEQVWVEVGTGHIVDPDTVDWDTRDRPDAEPAEGLRHAREVEQRDQLLLEYFLPRDLLETAGLRERVDTASDTEDDADTGEVGDASEGEHPGERGTRFGQVDQEQVAADRRAAAEAAAQAAAQAAEIDRAARRRVRELNKLGLAAKATRIEFVTRLLARRTPPTQAALFMTRSLLADPGLTGEYHTFDSALKLLGIEGYRSRLDMLATLDTTKPTRAQVIALALVLGGYEHRADKDLWRYTESAVRRYLSFLRELGYPLVPVELAALGEIKAVDIDIDNLTATGEPADTDAVADLDAAEETGSDAQDLPDAA
ncbi:ParB/RepB/Spo0J family partition protein [Nocardia pseudovaccinii]|uniref:ParB/RepB/Spo0J family partition protein n=1 Tax=Nocardia pseudovaccinii TaxID=189540 RepID=UPI0007A52BF7|nr:ParB N-terminal domain-containing protein [Nocardia pseudovaccinii]